MPNDAPDDGRTHEREDQDGELEKLRQRQRALKARLAEVASRLAAVQADRPEADEADA